MPRPTRFLLTPLREGRHYKGIVFDWLKEFLLTPLREGRLYAVFVEQLHPLDFYSRPCGRGDSRGTQKPYRRCPFLLTPLREGRLCMV